MMACAQEMPRRLRRVMPFLLVSLLQTGVATAKAETACPLPAEKTMSVAQLFFGRSIPGRGPLTDAEWSAFAATVLGRNFPDGFTVYDGDGQWLDRSTGKVVRERTKVVIIATKNNGTLARRVNSVSETYKRLYRQQSVGVITENVCAGF